MSCNQDFLDSIEGVVDLNGIRYYPSNSVEPILNSLQQLKAEIAEIVDKYERLELICGLNWEDIAHGLMKDLMM